MLYGMEAGWLSPITKTLQSEHSPLGSPLSSSTISVCASVSAISSAVTVPLYSYLVDKYGRKWIIFAITIPQAEAYKTVAFLRGVTKDDKIVVNEIDEMQKQEEEFKSISKIGIRTILRDKSWRRGLIIMLATFTVHAWNGAFAILTYASAILSSTGNVFDISPELQTISFPIVMIIASLSLTGIAERFGRRVLLAAGFFFSALALTALGVAMLVQQHGYMVPGWLPITSMMVASAMYAGSVRPLPYIISTEMFNFQVRAKVMGSIVMYAWLVVATQLFAYGPLADTLGLHGTFICYGFINVLGVILCYVMPETKDKTDEEIRHVLAHNTKRQTVSQPT
ncbi:facilitated trehalose transporter Tret1-like isoform X3 [Leptidea sinapis]|uniref:facilitated trehalose transporter Tret1-like isoform X3 n=1 Tax=Leptidea sinapis TaxID=189913 RepID=UPI0021C4ACF3|nr:facilitated trehalose transporter Tret1-like isoform X3 [Leptidea sinapis]